MKDVSEKTEFVKKYYGRVLQNKSDLQTSACRCSDELLHPLVRDIEKQLDNEILAKFYGCGSPVPPDLEGRVVLDLGCGTGKDVFIASRLAGPEGYVIGVDMTDEQLEVGQRHIDSQMEKFGYSKPNVDLKKGYIEDLKSIGIEDNSVDVLISNCVINLSTDKRAVFSEIFRVLKPGGRTVFFRCLCRAEGARALAGRPSVTQRMYRRRAPEVVKGHGMSGLSCCRKEED